ncbi:sugar ABC transporter substrate-binding protein [Microbacterium sp. GXF7504]
MNNSTPRIIRRGAVGLAALISAGALVVGCASGTPDAAPAESGSAAADGFDRASLEAYVDGVTRPADAFPILPEPVEGATSHAGGTVFYIPISLRAPIFAATQTSLGEALGEVGITLQSCPADGNPANIASCVEQAKAADALAIVADAVPYQMGAEAFTSARNAGIPVVISSQGPNEVDFPADETLAYIPSGAVAMDRAMLHWAALDSDGTANILVTRSTDGQWNPKFMKDAMDELPEYCPGCTIQDLEISTANQPQLQANLAAELISNADITYLITDFAQYIPQATGAITDSGRTDIKYLTGAATLGAIEGVAGGAFAGVAAEATAFTGWQQADTVLRLLAGQEVPEREAGYAPIRLFTKSTLPEQINEAAEQSGEWFGPTTFKDEFLALWK